MKKITSIFVAVLFVFAVAIQISAQAQRDIAVVGHNRNNQNAIAVAAPNSNFSGWAGANASFTLFTTPNPLPGPGSYLKNKLNGVHDGTCTANLAVANAPAVANFYNFGQPGINLLFTGQGSFTVTCTATGSVLRGTFSRAILNAVNGSNSASIILLGNTVTYDPSTNVINNAIGNFAFSQASLSIAIITDQPAVVALPSAANPNGSISLFRAYSNITFGARKI